VSQQTKALEILSSLGIDLVVGYIFFDPISTIEDIRQSLRFYLKLNQYDISKFSQRLRVLPGTLLYKRMKRNHTVSGNIWKTKYEFVSSQIDTVYALVGGLFFSLLPIFLEKKIYQHPPTEHQAYQIIKFMEKTFKAALKMAEDGLEKDDDLISKTIHQWSSEIIEYVQ
jgi:radical SAM superfamily enzyme YgiQ (UPF0313 family)